MKALLVFPPPSSPTYIPLGIATLSAWIRRFLPSVSVSVLDLNIALWERIIATRPDFQEAAAFMKSGAVFFDRVTYQQATAMINRVSDKVHKAVDQARDWLEQKAGTSAIEASLFQTAQQIRCEPYDMVGFSVMFPLQLYYALALAKMLKDLGGPPVVLGGASISAVDRKELLSACPWIDALVAGEGERSFADWLQQKDPASIGGLVWRRGSTITVNPKSATTTLNEVPPPDFSGFELRRYLNPEPVLPVVFSRGCQWRKCRFCAHNFPFSGYRTKRYQQIVDELTCLQREYGCRHFYCADQYVNPQDGWRLAEAILEAGLDIRYHVMGRPSAEYHAALLSRMHQSGCRWISWGIETASDRLLELCNKGTKAAEIVQVLRDAHRCGISNLAMMIFGLPTSSDEDLEATLNFYDQIRAEVDAFTTSRFQLFARTGFASDPGRYGLKITGREVLLNLGGRLVHSNRLFFDRSGEGESRSQLRALHEVTHWETFRKWYSDDPFFESLVNEHYLLFAAQKAAQPLADGEPAGLYPPAGIIPQPVPARRT